MILNKRATTHTKVQMRKLMYYYINQVTDVHQLCIRDAEGNSPLVDCRINLKLRNGDANKDDLLEEAKGIARKVVDWIFDNFTEHTCISFDCRHVHLTHDYLNNDKENPGGAMVLID